MGAFAAGQVVILPFPFSNLSGNKRRPALLLAHVGHGDWIACQITSSARIDPLAVAIGERDFRRGGLHRDSFIRPGKIFSASEELFVNVAGELNCGCVDAVRNAVIQLIQGDKKSEK